MSFKLILLVFLSFPMLLGAQKVDLKWGKIPKDQLEMKVYPPDPEAEAVILGKKGKYFLATNTIGTFVHQRLKILTDGGAEKYADQTISYYHGDDLENVRAISAQTILPDGTIIPVKKQNIFHTETSDYWSKVTISFPAVEEGCVLEWRYIKDTRRYIFLDDWYFQYDIPVVYSELEVDIPERFVYKFLKKGLVTQDNTLYYADSLPGLKEEPYITTMDDYYTQISFQLEGYIDSYGAYNPILSTWEQIEEELINSISFGAQYLRSGFSRKAYKDLEPLITEDLSDMEKLNVIADFVEDKVQWNRYYSTRSPEGVKAAYQNGKGSSAELNLLFLGLARAAGFEKAYPLLVGHREKGAMLPIYPFVDQFAHTAALIELDGERHLFDLGDELRPNQLLRQSCLNQLGWVVKENGESEWIQLSPPQAHETYLINAQLDDQGKLEGSIQARYKNYASETMLSLYSEDQPESVWQEIISEHHSDSEVPSHERVSLSPDKTQLTESFDLNIHQAGQVIEDYMYIDPFPFKNFSENFFRLEKRAYPVDIPYPFSEDFVISLTLPDSYTIESIPEPARISLPNKGVTLSYLVQDQQDKVQIISKFAVDQIYYTPQEYEPLKYIFDLYIEKLGEQIVLKKKT